jgi:hypothetical protein
MTTPTKGKKPAPIDPHPAQPLSAKAYAIIAAIGLIFAVAFTLSYVYQVPHLIQSGTQSQIFYVLLIPWGLASAAFLFGAMKSYARWTYKDLGLIELGGPVALFCLVIVGGFKLVPKATELLDLTVRAHSADRRDAMITSGKVTLDLDNDRRTATFGSNGEAEFKGIPAKFREAPIKVLPQVEGFEEQWQTDQSNGNVIEIALLRGPLATTVLTGTISPPPASGKKIRILVDGQNGETRPDELGRFKLQVAGKAGDRVRLRVFADNGLVYDDYQVLPGPVTVSLHNSK